MNSAQHRPAEEGSERDDLVKDGDEREHVEEREPGGFEAVCQLAALFRAADTRLRVIKTFSASASRSGRGIA